jgi:hypothetical protein
MSETLEDRFRYMLISALNVDHPQNLGDLAGELAEEAAGHFRQAAVSVDASYPVTSALAENSWRTESRPFAELLPGSGPEPPARRPVFLGSKEEQDALEAALDAALSSSSPSQRIPLTRIREQLRAPWLRTVRISASR